MQPTHPPTPHRTITIPLRSVNARIAVALALAALTAPAWPAGPALAQANGEVWSKLVLAPAFTLPGSSGGSDSLGRYKGKVRIVDFWATWCPPCKKEIPGFVALQKKYGSRGLVVMGLSVDDEAATVKAFAAQAGINYPSLMADAATQAAYGGIRGIPTTFVIGRKGYIYKKYVGGVPPEVFAQDVEALL